MSDSFFDFDTSLLISRGALEPSVGEEEDYDALNDETFGDSSLSTDWEENHEKLAAELKGEYRRSFDDENGVLSARVASYILDDEGEDVQSKSSNLPKQLTNASLHWWPNGLTYTSLTDRNRVPLLPLNSIPNKTGPMLMMCTVEEVERNIRSKVLSSPTSGIMLEDLERELTSATIQYPLSTSTPINVPLAPPGYPATIPRSEHPVAVHAGFPVPVARDMYFKQSGPGLIRLPMQNVVRPVVPISNHQDEFSYFHVSCDMSYTISSHHPQYPIPPFQPIIDEYAGLMSAQEKQWLASIQMMQLSTNQPFQDDYYYQMYQSRQQGKCGHKLGSHGVKNNRSETVSTKPAYTPLQFENSLGKLQVGSVTAPRKIIDMDVVETVECTSQNSSRKCKQLLLEIEITYSQILLVEEINSPIMGSKSDVDPKEVMKKINNTLLQPNKLTSIMGIKKGKTLILRILPHLENGGPVIHCLISNMMVISRKDTEQTLLRLLPFIRNWLTSVPLNTLVQLSKTFDNSLSTLLTNKFTVSVLANMIERAETVIPSANDNEVIDWIHLISKLIETSQDVNTIERPVVGVDGKMLSTHLARARPTSEDKQDLSILQRALSNLQISDIKLK